MHSDELTVTAVRYARMASTQSEQLYRFGVYGIADGPIVLDYYYWIIRTPAGITLVDTGFNPQMLTNRPGREVLIHPMAAFRELGFQVSDVHRIIVTHFHYDHIGNLSQFGDAELVVQKREFDYWTGIHGAQPAAAASAELSEIGYIAKKYDEGMVRLIDGNFSLDHDIHLRRVGGHCPGQQIVIIGSPGIVLCSDALHFRQELDRYSPFKVFFNLQEVFSTYDELLELEDSGYKLVPGHDPLVRDSFPPLPSFNFASVVYP